MYIYDYIYICIYIYIQACSVSCLGFPCFENISAIRSEPCDTWLGLVAFRVLPCFHYFVFFPCFPCFVFFEIDVPVCFRVVYSAWAFRVSPCLRTYVLTCFRVFPCFDYNRVFRVFPCFVAIAFVHRKDFRASLHTSVHISTHQYTSVHISTHQYT